MPANVNRYYQYVASSTSHKRTRGRDRNGTAVANVVTDEHRKTELIVSNGSGSLTLNGRQTRTLFNTLLKHYNAPTK